MRDRDRGILIMLFGVIAITPDSLLVRLMQLEGGSTVDQNLQSIFWKYLLTVPLMSGFSVRHSGGVLKLLQRLKRTSTSGWRHIVVGGLCQVWLSISLNLAFVETKAARALLFFGLNPLWAAFMARLVLGQAVPARTVVALLLVTCAICVVFLPEIVPSLEEAQNQTGKSASDASSVEPTVRGDLCGVSAGAALGAMIAVSASAKSKCPEAAMLLSVVLGSALVVLLSLAWQAAAGRASMGAVSARFVGIALADSMLIAIVFTATVTAPRYASSAEVGLVHPLEAVLGPVWVYLGIGEAPSRWTIIGGALLIGTLVGHEVWGCQSEARTSSKRPAAAPGTSQVSQLESEGWHSCETDSAPPNEPEPAPEPIAKGPPSPPPSPPEPITRRLELLAAAEDAVHRTWAYPAYPDDFLSEVTPHLHRYIVAEGVKLQTAQAQTRALYAVLVKDDAQCPDVTAAEVAATLEVAPRSCERWRAKVRALRSEAADGAALLELSTTPSASAPPSPPAEAPSAIEALADSLSALQPWRLRNSNVPQAAVDRALEKLMDAMDEPLDTAPPRAAAAPNPCVDVTSGAGSIRREEEA